MIYLFLYRKISLKESLVQIYLHPLLHFFFSNWHLVYLLEHLFWLFFNELDCRGWLLGKVFHFSIRVILPFFPPFSLSFKPTRFCPFYLFLSLRKRIKLYAVWILHRRFKCLAIKVTIYVLWIYLRYIQLHLFIIVQR